VLEWIGKRYVRMQEIHHEERGFTLIELLVVVAIIGILMAIALPLFLNQRAKASDARAQANVREAASAVSVYYTETGNAPANVAALRGYGFQGSDPAVVLFATGSAATANWCVSTPTNGGTQAHWKMMDEDGQPQGAAGPCTTADG
jgi:prepilin-type N-terminal cleavage/methylation domain-containing protein